MSKIAIFCMTFCLVIGFGSVSYASLTKEQSDEVAEFAISFINEGNARRDQNGYPLLVYALSNNFNKSIEIRRSGYNSELYHVFNNNYHKKNGQYLDLGNKWTMDCGDYIAYVYHQTLGLDMMDHSNEDPWHIKDMYADANKGANSKYFEFVYKNVSIANIDESKLQKGDVVLYFGPKDNHGLIYVGENMQAAHASRNAIRYSKNPPILGFEVVQFNRFYKTSTVVSIVRIKDGVVPEDQKVNGTIIWPDTGEEGILIERERIEKQKLQELVDALNNEMIILEEEPVTLEVLGAEEINPLHYEEVLSQESLKDNPIYIEKEMIGWITDGVKKLYEQHEDLD